MDATAIEFRLKAFFEADARGALAVYLFGSVARGEARPDSDVDVGVLFAAEPPATLGAPQFAIEAELERFLGRPVQIVALNRASADLVHRVLRDGRLVLDLDRAARIRFEVRSGLPQRRRPPLPGRGPWDRPRHGREPPGRPAGVRGGDSAEAVALSGPRPR